mmetsp:Transcript_14142/g.19703  ORF Transcript_14142/g.19703 Transcript_14142/m.19703 type:complete len:139 (+) Transcript_14142:793-1209(+)
METLGAKSLDIDSTQVLDVKALSSTQYNSIQPKDNSDFLDDTETDTNLNTEDARRLLCIRNSVRDGTPIWCPEDPSIRPEVHQAVEILERYQPTAMKLFNILTNEGVINLSSIQNYVTNTKIVAKFVFSKSTSINGCY